MKRIALLGSTGSIGTSCLDVVAEHGDRVEVVGLSAHRQWEMLAEQAGRFGPRRAVLADESLEGSLDGNRFPPSLSLEFGADALERLAADDAVDMVVAAIVGAAGLRSSWAALEAGKDLALANKETLVVAGPLVTRLAAERGAAILPVDSEHSAIFQALQAGRPTEVRRVVLTASGGPFRGWSKGRLAEVTPAEALEHPTWDMGAKITIDSATMMNKALEVIEARWLFNLPADRIEVVVHPQSILHSFVEFVDGSVVAQLSPPDMRLPIQYALTYPDRLEGVGPRMDWTASTRLDLEPPDLDAFPALGLGFEAARRAGTCGAVLNAAKEVAVERFLNADLKFPDVARLCGDVLDGHDFDPSPTLTDLLRLDARTREEARRWTA